MIYDFKNEANSVQGLVPQVLADTAQGSSKDFSNCEISTGAIVSIGAYGANNTSTTIRIEESADGSTGWAAISGMSCSPTTSNTIFVLRGLRQYRYVRANAVTVAGTTPSVACSVEIVAQKRYTNPSSGVDRSPST